MTPAAIRFTLTLYIDVPCDDDGRPHYSSKELEKSVLHHLRKIDGDCDCEVMTAEPLNADQVGPR